MENEPMKDHPKVYRLRKVESIEFHHGYRPAPQLLIELMTEALAKVPEEYRESCEVAEPDENGDDWALVWVVYESDEKYKKRVEEYEAVLKSRIEHVIDKYRHARKRAMEAPTIGEKRGAIAEMQRLEHTATEMDLELPRD